MTLLLAGILLAESWLLWLGQRRIFGLVALRSRALALVLSFPGTVLHEGAHWLACKLLAVGVMDVELFRPRQQPDGSVRLGAVTHARVDPLRMTLVAIAPVVFVPALLVGLAYLILGSKVLEHPLDAFTAAELWQQIAVAYIAASCGSAAFPSPGDKITFLGALLVIVPVAVAVAVLDATAREDLLRLLVTLMAPAAASALAQLLLLRR